MQLKNKKIISLKNIDSNKIVAYSYFEAIN